MIKLVARVALYLTLWQRLRLSWRVKDFAYFLCWMPLDHPRLALFVPKRLDLYRRAHRMFVLERWLQSGVFISFKEPA